MTTIWEIYEWLQFITDTNRNGACSPEEAAKALDAAQQQYYQERLAVKDQIALRMLHADPTLTSNDSGLVTYPADFGTLVAIMKGTKALEEIRHTEVYDRMNSALYPPTYNDPVYVVEKSGFQLYPKMTHEVALHYYARPSTPVIAYVVNPTTGAVTYDAANSRQLDFPQDHWTNIILKSCAFLGVNLGDGDVLALTKLNGRVNDQ